MANLTTYSNWKPPGNARLADLRASVIQHRERRETLERKKEEAWEKAKPRVEALSGAQLELLAGIDQVQNKAEALHSLIPTSLSPSLVTFTQVMEETLISQKAPQCLLAHTEDIAQLASLPSLAKALVRAGKTEKALALLEHAERQARRFPQAHFLQAIAKDSRKARGVLARELIRLCSLFSVPLPSFLSSLALLKRVGMVKDDEQSHIPPPPRLLQEARSSTSSLDTSGGEIVAWRVLHARLQDLRDVWSTWSALPDRGKALRLGLEAWLERSRALHSHARVGFPRYPALQEDVMIQAVVELRDNLYEGLHALTEISDLASLSPILTRITNHLTFCQYDLSPFLQGQVASTYLAIVDSRLGKAEDSFTRQWEAWVGGSGRRAEEADPEIRETWVHAPPLAHLYNTHVELLNDLRLLPLLSCGPRIIEAFLASWGQVMIKVRSSRSEHDSPLNEERLVCKMGQEIQSFLHSLFDQGEVLDPFSSVSTEEGKEEQEPMFNAVPEENEEEEEEEAGDTRDETSEIENVSEAKEVEEGSEVKHEKER
ncbi:MAG: hypothetical protein DHS80DRAFT_29482 [Piptocephalis tieghemiana]|nr:MAG: hypothetical protein DHS80DRAFT_29482 [Piptocephalis tieghemiana]